MNNKALKLSLVIPVYNEEDHIKACLDAVANQTHEIDEVFVIDNNCTDNTIKLARRYRFVKVLHEPVQGIIAARNTGFSAASGDVVAKINASSYIDRNWAERLRQDFRSGAIDAVTGMACTRALPFSARYTTRLWTWLYYLSREAKFGHVVLWGGNLAMTKDAWRRIQHNVCLDDKKVHEDQDMSCLIIRNGGTIIRDNKLLQYTDGEEYTDFPRLWEYRNRAAATKRLHQGDLHNKKADITKLPWYSRSWRHAICVLPGIIFTSYSFLAYIIAWPFKAFSNR